jgi:hypothetical protein
VGNTNWLKQVCAIGNALASKSLGVSVNGGSNPSNGIRHVPVTNRKRFLRFLSLSVWLVVRRDKVRSRGGGRGGGEKTVRA